MKFEPTPLLRRARRAFTPSLGVVVMTLTVLLTAHHFETILYPVITEFKVSDVSSVNGALALSGTLTKRRRCKFKSLEAYSNSTKLLQYNLGATSDSLPLGKNQWGPWLFAGVPLADIKSIRLVANHNCSLPWNTRTDLTHFYLKVVNESL